MPSARAVRAPAIDRLLTSDPKHWAAQALLWSATLVLALAHQGGLLTLAFPALATLVGLWLFVVSPARYVGFVWWMWFLSPEVRRFADFVHGGYTPTSPIQIAPVAVTMISGLGLVRRYRLLGTWRGLPMLLILVAIGYAFAVGIVSSGPAAAVYDLANWLYPVLIGFHIVAHWRDYPAYREVIVTTFVRGMLVMGVYGVVQFFIMPQWDAMWMIGSEMASQGDPVPMGVRVFSTMNSSGPFALAMMGALVLVPASTDRLRWVAAAAGFAAFGLSLVRSTWGGWVIALAIQLAKSSNLVRIRIVLGLAVLAALSMPMLAFGPVADRVSARLQTITNLDDDQSYASRNAFYATFAETAFTNVAGMGLGATGTSTKLSNEGGKLGKYGNFDSGVMNIPFVLGWPGTLLYLSGLGWLLVRALRVSFSLGGDKFAQACLSLAGSVFAMIVFANSFIGTGGLLMYMSIASLLSAAQWRKSQRQAAIRRAGPSLI
ncbi:glucose-6-phosphate isomerase [Trinickia fusca]|uniref:Glucose-6-phosphate isomerase n=1 Tax=Trinickia fusca TaxID=2419777 RepID=A0A494XC16_9BURK|nr:glucose-6-phosphate isomerase [Trinickia fusca]RKP48305.1 glucose-6-phosphate isomerase [Trinickia fusca]